jgi:UDPglucose 6-dehydrogenase
VESAVNSSIPLLKPNGVIVMKSTLPIGSAARFSEELRPFSIHVASNPEFLSEGNALLDFQKPSRIVVGAESETIAAKVMALYEKIDSPKMFCGLTSAEAIKHASNSFLAIKLSFINELSSLCEKSGGDISDVTKGMSLDPRIGDKFLSPGPGWGGSCYPKDTLELSMTGRSLGVNMLTVEAAIESNSQTGQVVVENLKRLLQGTLLGKRIAIWGLAFKANTDDTRDSPALRIVEILLQAGASVVAYDPVAKPSLEFTLETADSAVTACADADALLILTEWEEFSLIQPTEVRSIMRSRPVVYDTRNVLDRASWSQEFEMFKGIGRS